MDWLHGAVISSYSAREWWIAYGPITIGRTSGTVEEFDTAPYTATDFDIVFNLWVLTDETTYEFPNDGVAATSYVASGFEFIPVFQTFYMTDDALYEQPYDIVDTQAYTATNFSMILVFQTFYLTDDSQYTQPVDSISVANPYMGTGHILVKVFGIIFLTDENLYEQPSDSVSVQPYSATGFNLINEGT